MQKLTVEVIKLMFKERRKDLRTLMLLSEVKGDAKGLAETTAAFENLKAAEEDFCNEFNVKALETA